MPFRGRFQVDSVKGLRQKLEALGQNTQANIRGDNRYIYVDEHYGNITIRFEDNELKGKVVASFPAVIRGRSIGGHGHDFVECRAEPNFTDKPNGKSGVAYEINERRNIPINTKIECNQAAMDDGSQFFWFDITSGYNATPYDIDTAGAADTWDVQDQADGEYGVNVSPHVFVEDSGYSYDIYSRKFKYDSNGNLVYIDEKVLELQIPYETQQVVTNVYWDATLGQLVQETCDFTVLDVANCGSNVIFDATVCATAGG
jgi:hypothetical protein